MTARFLLPFLLVTNLVSFSDHSIKTLSAGRAGYYQSKVDYPVFQASRPMATVMNSVMKAEALKAHKGWITEVVKMQKGEPKPTSPWEQEITAEVSWNTPRLVGITFGNYEYSGGAHPNHGLSTFNFGIVDGKSRQLKLSDFFEAGFDAKKYVSKLIIAKLMKEENADGVKNGDLKVLDAKMSERFLPEADGLRWYFNPYDVGSYAAGDFEVKLTLAELGPKFKKAMLLMKG